MQKMIIVQHPDDPQLNEHLADGWKVVMMQTGSWAIDVSPDVYEVKHPVCFVVIEKEDCETVGK
jgi:hypothetical protein